jgi:hypothetical protein
MVALKKEESIDRFRVEQYVGSKKNPKKKFTKIGQLKLKKICTKYNNNTNIEDFIRDIAYNF